MGIYRPHFVSLMNRTLAELAEQLGNPCLCAPEAAELVEGTFAQESLYGYYLRQLGRGPGKGGFQIEHKPTFRYLQKTFGDRVPILRTAGFDDLEWNLKLGIIVCRLWYWVVAEPLPPVGDVPKKAAYWKEHFNTEKGRGTVEQFIGRFETFILQQED